MHWDIFCRVIDNHGDAGVGWRLAAELAARGHAVRLWIDDAAPIAWMAPRGQRGVEVIAWDAAAPELEPGDAVIEAFGCDPPAGFVERLAQIARARGAQPAWINLEYLSAEKYVERSHGLPSPVGSGPGAGLVKRFLYPGFTERTGGLLRERDLGARQQAFDRAGWLVGHGVAASGARVISLFCYEPETLPALLLQLACDARPTQLLVTAGRATRATRAALAALDLQSRDWNAQARLQLHFLPLLSQRDYDRLLWSCDLNFVRGEDSIVRGLLAGVPLVWQIYPQDDLAHHAKLEAFLDWLAPPADLRRFFRAWNGVTAEALPRLDLPAWQPAATLAREKVAALPELASTVERFGQEHARI
jgi:uncharacterized repeat protein (TIGR03837 family)